MSTSDLLFYGTQPEAIDVALAPALRGPIAEGPMISAGAAPLPIEAHVCDPMSPSTVVLTLDGAFRRSWNDKLNDLGSGSLQLMNDDPDLPSVSDGSLIRFDLHGYAAMTWVVSDRKKQSLDSGEEAAQMTTLSGPSHAAILSSSLVYPVRTKPISPQLASRPIGGAPPEENRIFSWAALDYDDTRWRTPTVQTSVAGMANRGAVWPTGFPDQAAGWIWNHQAREGWAPRGWMYFRKKFTTTSTEKKIKVFAVGDSTNRVYFDGSLLFENAEWFNTADDVKSETVDVEPGDHVIGVECTNGAPHIPGFIQGAFDPAGLAVCVYALDDAGNFTTQAQWPLVHTDTTWKMLDYPPVAPGVTVGEVMAKVIAEVNQRRGTPAIATTFTATLDSAGNPWEPVAEISTKVGTDLASFFRELSATYMDWWMSPGGYLLWAYQRGYRGRSRSVSFHAPTNPLDPMSGNLAALTHQVVS